MAYKPISDYGVIGDMHSAALVGLDGSIDWLCFPRFDSPSVFAAILDDVRGGRFRLRPARDCKPAQRYLPDTNILCTTFAAGGGEVEVEDLMPMRRPPAVSDHLVLRVVRGVSGVTEMECFFEPRLDYARGDTRLREVEGGVVAENSGRRLALSSPVPLHVEAGSAKAVFAVHPGQEIVFALQWDADRPPDVSRWSERVESTARQWRDIVDSIHYEGRWRDVVRRSVLALHLLVYVETGALVAAVTTSLPEWVGAGRNWDYRFCWIRDAAFTLDALDRLDHIGETARFLEWLTVFCRSCGARLQTLYGVQYEEKLTETTLDHLEGYRGSRPVRVGNAAHNQLQMDIFGDLMVAVASYRRAGGEVSDRMWSTIRSLVEAVIRNWGRPDRGIWEVRGEKRHFVHSKVMCWLAVDRAIALAEALGKPAALASWRAVRDEIRADILERGWNPQVHSFVQYYGADHTDATLLLMPLVGFLPADDERMRSTVHRLRQELEENGLLRRYRTEHADDGVGGEEGVFTMCALWLAGYLTHAGELDEATRLFERVLGCANHVGLFSEMVNPVTGEALGNFPQAFTHVSLIHTARNLDLALSRRGAPASSMRVGEPAREVAAAEG